MQELVMKILKFLAKGLLSLLLLMFLYLVAAIVGSAIPVNKDQSESGEVTIYLRTNGVHTSFIFPLKNQVIDWSTYTDPRHTLSERTDFQYVSFGWGDLEFYRKTPEWDDLQFPVAFQAVFLSKPSALHVEFLDVIRYRQPTLPVQISRTQYRVLSEYVLNSFQTGPSGEVLRVKELHYDRHDTFYRAKRSLHFFYTCNTWVNEGLKKAGLRACLWTPFDEGIFFQYR
ncbi:conserved hypothetical protein [Salinimicrobium catena]|uniref:TIGR02117 family protein n=1 Tax=Salinimicrobium catena TaxID=390640 RepID=A0A1H5NUF9_9FLAO|nr:TIGR02117 family protein [Salinimicrobium catena]SDL61516.1 conserved hypothetical protein [Salinimicrobium catena]SEF05216.1 conserved hypothetical protein [Salinimicrobium catena]